MKETYGLNSTPHIPRGRKRSSLARLVVVGLGAAGKPEAISYRPESVPAHLIERLNMPARFCGLTWEIRDEGSGAA
jgi:hypothetical protein